MKMSYSDFANVYDSLMQGVDYPKMCEKYLSLLKLHSHTPRLVLDAACGTGAFTFELCSRGFDVVGVDCSQEMLSVARERIGDKALLLCQELQHLDLYGTIDTVFCTLDGLNHITDFDELRASIKKIALFTEPCGMFIFDVNTLFTTLLCWKMKMSTPSGATSIKTTVLQNSPSTFSAKTKTVHTPVQVNVFKSVRIVTKV